MTFQTFTGAQYLKIDIANNFGKDGQGRALDKLTWNERIEWFDTHEHELDGLVAKAEKPALFFAGVQAWKAYKAKEPSGYPISLDGCSSGLQILACLLGDRKAASLCNVVDTGKREDAYTLVYEWMLQRLGGQIHLDREPVKKAIMTSLYGSKKVPEEVFGNTQGLLELFFEAMDTLAPGVWQLNTAFLGMWNPQALSYHWTMPDNFHVHTKVMSTVTEEVKYEDSLYDIVHKENLPQKEGRSLGANITHSVDSYIVRELTRRCDYDKEQIMRVKVALCAAEGGTPDMEDPDTQMVSTLWNHYLKTGLLSARIFDHLNEDSVSVITDRAVVWKLIYSLPKKPFKVMSIHDCFRVLPNHGNDVRKQYNLLLAELAKGKLLDHIVSMVLDRPIALGKFDDDLWKDVVETNYALS